MTTSATSSLKDRGLNTFFNALVEGGVADQSIDPAVARLLLQKEVPLLPLVHAAGQIRRAFFGTGVQMHLLHNVQSGACPEDCGYCGQAKSSDAPIQPYKLKSKDEIIAEAARARDSGAYRYCMVLSGRGPSDSDIDHMVECIGEVKRRFGLQTCLSAGLLDEAKARRLQNAGLDRLNHNLNTSERHYPAICTTHTWRDRADTLRAARGAGLQICSGLIAGMGETIDDLVEVAGALRSVGADSIPVNFLVPIPGNRVIEPMCDGEPLTPELCLRVLCMMRCVNPSAEVRIGAGRETHLRSMQALALEPANSLFIDGYLLTTGSDTLATVRLIRDAGFEIELGKSTGAQEFQKQLDSLDMGGTERQRLAVLKTEHLSPRKLAKLHIDGVESPV